MSIPTTSNLLSAYLVNGLRRALELGEFSCYESIAPAYVDGQNQRVIQICGGGSTPEGNGHGWQEGGALNRRESYNIIVWWRTKFDMHQHSEVALSEDYLGLTDFVEQIRLTLSMTTLGGMSLEPIRWDGESSPQWYDMDLGVVRQDIRVSGTVALELPTTVTLTAADVGA